MSITGLGVEPTLDELQRALTMPYYAQIKGEHKADVQGAIVGLLSAYEANTDLCARVRDYLWHESEQITEELVQSKRHLATDVAGRMDEFSRGQMAGLKRAAELLADPKQMQEALTELEGTKPDAR